MATLFHYRQAIVTILSNLAETTGDSKVEALALFDSARDNYLLLAAGWDGIRRIHHIIAHLHVRDGKIWIEADNTDAGIVQQLLDDGIPKDAIVLAFHSPQKRALTEFANVS